MVCNKMKNPVIDECGSDALKAGIAFGRTLVKMEIDKIDVAYLIIMRFDSDREEYLREMKEYWEKHEQ